MLSLRIVAACDDANSMEVSPFFTGETVWAQRHFTCFSLLRRTPRKRLVPNPRGQPTGAHQRTGERLRHEKRPWRQPPSRPATPSAWTARRWV